MDFSDVFAVAKSTFGSDVTIGNYNVGIIDEFDFEPVVDINVVGIRVCVRTLWYHDDVIKWKHFPRNRPFVRGIHRSPMHSPHKGQSVTRSFDVFYDMRLNKRMSTQGWGWWLGTPWRPLWRHCNVEILKKKFASLALCPSVTGTWILITRGQWCGAVVFSVLTWRHCDGKGHPVVFSSYLKYLKYLNFVSLFLSYYIVVMTRLQQTEARTFMKLVFKSPRYTGGDFMFLYRFAAAGRRFLSTR